MTSFFDARSALACCWTCSGGGTELFALQHRRVLERRGDGGIALGRGELAHLVDRRLHGSVDRCLQGLVGQCLVTELRGEALGRALFCPALGVQIGDACGEHDEHDAEQAKQDDHDQHVVHHAQTLSQSSRTLVEIRRTDVGLASD